MVTDLYHCHVTLKVDNLIATENTGVRLLV